VLIVCAVIAFVQSCEYLELKSLVGWIYGVWMSVYWCVYMVREELSVWMSCGCLCTGMSIWYVKSCLCGCQCTGVSI
jgi:hypothetical protein